VRAERTLFDQDQSRADRELERVLEEQPEIGRLFLKFALEAYRAGRTHYGARAIVELIRFETTVRQRGEFKINNNLTPALARWAMRTSPQLEGFFQTRERTPRKRVPAWKS
jgi:tRNA U38,U39,U40 pseudouridine synthase TruA